MGTVIRAVWLVAPLLAGVLVAAPAQDTRESPRPLQELQVETGGEGGASDGETETGDPPLVGVREGAGASTFASAPRLLDRAKVEDDGKAAAPALERIWEAIVFNNEAWVGAPRRDLLAFLRGADASASATFTEADVKIVAALQAGSGATVDGKVDEPTVAVFFATGFVFSTRTPSWDVELEFFPGELEDLDRWEREIRLKVTMEGGDFRDVEPPNGEGRIYVRVDGRLAAAYRARGGPPAPIRDLSPHVAEPTKPGSYRLGPAHSRVTSSWYNSQIPWGAEIRQVEDGYQYRRPGGGRWWWATPHEGSTLKKPYAADDFDDLPTVIRDGEARLIWNKNDFGPLAWQLMTTDLYVHTTPDAEESAAKGEPIALIVSHGCIHIVPAERDEMIERGYLRKDARFVVRDIEAHLLPSRARRDALSEK